MQAIDQRLAEVLQGIVSLFAGVVVAFLFGWNMAPIGIITCIILVILQSAVSQYLKFRGQKDVKVAEEAASVSFFLYKGKTLDMKRIIPVKDCNPWLQK